VRVIGISAVVCFLASFSLGEGGGGLRLLPRNQQLA
jgi:hypothetical protein